MLLNVVVWGDGCRVIISSIWRWCHSACPRRCAERATTRNLRIVSAPMETDNWGHCPICDAAPEGICCSILQRSKSNGTRTAKLLYVMLPWQNNLQPTRTRTFWCRRLLLQHSASEVSDMTATTRQHDGFHEFDGKAALIITCSPINACAAGDCFSNIVPPQPSAAPLVPRRPA